MSRIWPCSQNLQEVSITMRTIMTERANKDLIEKLNKMHSDFKDFQLANIDLKTTINTSATIIQQTATNLETSLKKLHKVPTPMYEVEKDKIDQIPLPSAKELFIKIRLGGHIMILKQAPDGIRIKTPDEMKNDYSKDLIVRLSKALTNVTWEEVLELNNKDITNTISQMLSSASSDQLKVKEIVRVLIAGRQGTNSRTAGAVRKSPRVLTVLRRRNPAIIEWELWTVRCTKDLWLTRLVLQLTEHNAGQPNRWL